MKPSGNDPLDNLLKDWAKVPAPDVHLAARVRQLADARSVGGAERGWSGFWSTLTWPRLTVASVCVGAALGVASVELRTRWHWRSPESVERYREWIQPVAIRTMGEHSP